MSLSSSGCRPARSGRSCTATSRSSSSASGTSTAPATAYAGNHAGASIGGPVTAVVAPASTTSGFAPPYLMGAGMYAGAGDVSGAHEHLSNRVVEEDVWDGDTGGSDALGRPSR